MPNLQQIKSQLKAAGIGTLEMLNSGAELIALIEAMEPSEIIEQAVHGEYHNAKGYAVATANRVIVAGGNAFNRRAETFFYDKISSITAGTRELTIHTSGNDASLKKIHNPQSARIFADLVRSRMGKPIASVPTAPPDMLEQLERLARLRDSGVLNQTEFEAQKKKILG